MGGYWAHNTSGPMKMSWTFVGRAMNEIGVKQKIISKVFSSFNIGLEQANVELSFKGTLNDSDFESRV